MTFTKGLYTATVNKSDAGYFFITMTRQNAHGVAQPICNPKVAIQEYKSEQSAKRAANYILFKIA